MVRKEVYAMPSAVCCIDLKIRCLVRDDLFSRTENFCMKDIYIMYILKSIFTGSSPDLIRPLNCIW